MPGRLKKDDPAQQHSDTRGGPNGGDVVDADLIRPLSFRRLLGRVAKVMAFLTCLLILALGCLYYMSQREPEFYQVALEQSPEVAKVQGEELETCVMGLYNAALSVGQWSGSIRQEQINGWLASELPAKFPELLESKVIADPRIAITPGNLSIAARVNYQGIRGVVVANVDVFRTDQPDQFAVRIRGIRVGAIPIPTKSLVALIDQGMVRSEFESHWSEIDGDPVLTFNVPEKFLALQDIYRIEIVAIDCEEGHCLVSGRTVDQGALDADSDQDQ